MTQHTVTRWISDWRHALIALGFGVLALCAAVFVPETRWEKLGLLVERIAEDPAGAAVIVSLLAGAVTTLRGAWMRTPPPAALLLVALALTLPACGAQLTATQRTALAVETQLCIANERAIVERQGTTEDEDRAALAAERARCDAARAAITEAP